MKLLKFAKNLTKTEPYLTIITIHREALDAGQKGIKSEDTPRPSIYIFRALWFFIPILIPLISLLTNTLPSTMGASIKDFIGVSIPLFVGIFFSLLLTIPDNIRKSRTSEIDKAYRSNLIRGYKHISSIILHLILVCIYILILYLISSIFSLKSHYLSLTYFTIIVSLSFHLITVIIYLVIRYFYLHKSMI